MALQEGIEERKKDVQIVKMKTQSIFNLYTQYVLIIGLLIVFNTIQGGAQVKYSVKSEVGFLKYRFHTVRVDPGPNWKGYNLDKKDGIDISLVNGVEFNQTLSVGIGARYYNFEGVNGLALYSDFEYLPLRSRLTPLINLQVGYSHLWNQYQNGTGTGLGELNVGLYFRLTDKAGFYAKSGFLLTQQSLLIPIKGGIKLSF
jgi:hypothetical protein